MVLETIPLLCVFQCACVLAVSSGDMCVRGNTANGQSNLEFLQLGRTKDLRYTNLLPYAETSRLP